MKRLLFLAAGMFAMGCDDYVFAGLLPRISVSLHTSIALAAQGFTAFGISYVVSAPICAFLLARKPIRHVLITALVVFIAGNVITLLSADLVMYLASRCIAGLGAGLLRKHFNGVFGSEAFTTQKPDPGPILEVCKRWNVSPSEAVVIGDSQFDVIAGKTAGARTVGVLYGFGDPETFRLNPPDFQIESADQLVRLFPVEDLL